MNKNSPEVFADLALEHAVRHVANERVRGNLQSIVTSRGLPAPFSFGELGV